jgi:hypothetical protein
MTTIKTLKKQNPDLVFDVVGMLKNFDPTENNKLTPFLIKELQKRIHQQDYEDSENPSRDWDEEHTSRLLISKNRLELNIKNILFDLLGRDNLNSLPKFVDHLNNKRIENPDVTSYSSWGEFLTEISKADLKMLDKELSKQIELIHQDEVWLILKPLSFKSSLTYGSNTKWCTASKYNEEYFYDYCQRGMLIYIINKVNGKKYAFYNNNNELSVWDQVDNRIDSIQTSIPYNLLLKIRDVEFVKNADSFTEEELTFYNRSRVEVKYAEPEPVLDGQDYFLDGHNV